jgi:hypothetical protein
MFRKVFLMVLLGAFVAGVNGQTTEFTYQGRLLDSSLPPTANYDFQFSLWDSLANGTQQGTTQTITGVAVTNGIFTVKLNFGDQFTGAARFIQIEVRPAGGGAYTTLAPRQSITSGPYAIRSLNSTTADTATNSLQLGGVAANQYVVTTDPRMTDDRNPLPGSGNYIQNQNAAPQSSSNFNVSGIGTADILNAATQYNIGGNRVLSLAGQNNLFAGVGAGAANTTGAFNSFFGSGAGISNTTGFVNSFFGSGAGGSNTTGTANSFFGRSAGVFNTTGNSNSFFGNSAGQFNTTGGENSFFGSGAGFSNTIGFRNSFFGHSTGELNTAGSLNSFFGTFAGNSNTTGGDNSFFGDSAGGQNTTGNDNSFFGRRAGLFNTTGGDNSFFGSRAGQANTTGIINSFFGSLAGQANTTGLGNSFFGASAGLFNTTGDDNSFFGRLAGTSNTTGFKNSFFGSSAGVLKTTGSDNSFFGTNAGDSTTIGNNNSFFGSNAGENNREGSNNTAIGANSDVSALATFSTAIGAGSEAFDSNTIQLGRTTGQDEVRVAGGMRVAGNLVLNGLGFAGVTDLCRNASFQISNCSSSLRYKTNVSSFGFGLDLVKRLRPITFDWKDGGMHDLGLGAEEVAAIEPLLVTYNKDGQVEGVKYDRIGVVLVNAVKEQQEQIERLQSQIDLLTKIICKSNPEACKDKE